MANKKRKPTFFFNANLQEYYDLTLNHSIVFHAIMGRYLYLFTNKVKQGKKLDSILYLESKELLDFYVPVSQIELTQLTQLNGSQKYKERKVRELIDHLVELGLILKSPEKVVYKSKPRWIYHSVPPRDLYPWYYRQIADIGSDTWETIIEDNEV